MQPKDSLSRKQRALWEEYLRHEQDRIRHIFLAALDAFIESLEGTPVSMYRPWAADLAARVVDDDETIPVRMPLFRRVLFPALLSGYEERLPGYARWIAGFSQLLYQCRSCAASLDVPATDIALLWRALEDDPQDERARLRLVDQLAYRLGFAIHEVPWGVLCGMNGARPEGCVELSEDLAQFERLAERASVTHDYRHLISECRLHFRAYADFLRCREAWPDYESYLDANEPGWREI